MVKKSILILLILSVLFVFSCQRKDTTSESGEDVILNYVPEDLSTITTPGFAITTSAALYRISGDDAGTPATKTVWAAALALGESIQVGESRRMTFQGNNREQDWIAIRRTDGTEGWATALSVVPAGRLAVVIEDRTFLHTQPGSINVSRHTLSRQSVVVFYPETESGGFVSVRGYDVVRKVFVTEDNSFVRRNSLSIREADVQSAILLQTALTLTTELQKPRRDALLESALLDYPDSVFSSEIFEVANPNTSGVIIHDFDTQ
ncbi:MAG: hypothetical protein FWC01_06820 [Treponema sp.]|nr:hypothetical protein [Treponema sp.]MCL2237561.1 hypothetical protein [Treponema sp.]